MAKLFCNNPFFAEYPLRMGKYILMSALLIDLIDLTMTLPSLNVTLLVPC